MQKGTGTVKVNYRGHEVISVISVEGDKVKWNIEPQSIEGNLFIPFCEIMSGFSFGHFFPTKEFFTSYCKSGKQINSCLSNNKIVEISYKGHEVRDALIEAIVNSYK